MAETKTYEEKIAEKVKKRDQLNQQIKALEKRSAAEERKKRTRRLIELGGIVESVLGRATTDEDKIRFMNFLKTQERNGKHFTRAMNDADSVESQNENK